MNNKEIEIAEKISEKISKTPNFSGIDEDGDPYSWNTSIGMFDIVNSARNIVHLFENVNIDDMNEFEIVEIFESIREEIRHIKYHIGDMTYLKNI